MSETVMQVMTDLKRETRELAEQLAAARREGEAVTQRAIQAEADLATSRAALEDVRRVVEYVPIHFNSHVYREAILRALAQEAGDAK